MHRISKLIVALAIGLVALTTAGVHSVTFARGDVIGHVYVNANTAPVNSIAGFDRHSDGSLTPLAGSPFAIGGAGAGSTVPSQGAIQLANNGKFLLAVDAGSNQISVARILDSGALVPVAWPPVSSGGVRPVSITVHGSLVYVANAGPGGSNYTGFTLNSGGLLTPIPGSTFPLPDSASPGEVLFNPSGNRLVGIRVGPDAGPSFVDSFTVGSDGRLTAAAGSPFAGQGVGAFGSAFRPTPQLVAGPGRSPVVPADDAPSQLFVANAHNGAGLGTVSAFSDSTTGVLTSIGASPFPDLQTAPCWVDISPDGQYLFAVNTASSSISRFSIAADGALTLIGSTNISNPTGLRAFDIRVDPSGHNLYVTGANRIAAFAVNGGSLTELAGSAFSLPAGVTAAFGIAID